MTPAPGAGALRAVLYLGGAVATAAGLHTVIAGARSIPGKRALLAIELAGPPALAAWQARVAARG
ncbi:MAG TPA: hypothetical protein VG126_05325 [Thermoleophilaceae bacterium]|nr:hypothetical protein [Thermoleophilaceae bacterium]